MTGTWPQASVADDLISKGIIQSASLFKEAYVKKTSDHLIKTIDSHGTIPESAPCMLVAQSCLTLRNHMDCSSQGSSVYGILQAGILEELAILFSRGSFRHRDQTQVSCTAGRIFTILATREPSESAPCWAWKLCIPTWEDLAGSFIAISSRLDLLIRLGYVQDLFSFNLVSGKLMNFCGSFNLTSGDLLKEFLWSLCCCSVTQ